MQVKFNAEAIRFKLSNFYSYFSDKERSEESKIESFANVNNYIPIN